ncbi:phage tail assembly chaperone [Mesorhizobium sp. LHD-90]|uniref:rcc01693 family protein n=1 Tax=Mesorhizobium sp. LHD-90 TaxID=3071414 RepID=UPI0027E13461|nr:rcc01693 family protein [Mesorhizobium sp. LHD-90]MDQ6436888.1 phage tail assembly chaperone [Mesorhizobium sp. LHD-90]
MSAAAGKGGEPFPWDTAMAVGFGLLRLSPHDFWAMTPREIERAMSFFKTGASAPPGRNELAALMMAFPDALPNR